MTTENILCVPTEGNNMLCTTLNGYQQLANKTAIYPRGNGLQYTTLGLVGEAGEIANKLKKVIRDDHGMLTVEAAEQLKAELGDVLWYVAMVAVEIGCDLEDIANANLEKLARRKTSGTLRGSGDNR